MTVKILMSWDILPDREQEYFEFVISEFIPEIKQLGIRPVDAWYTMYGDHPQIMVSARSRSQSALNLALASREWTQLRDNLLTFIDNFSYKIIPARSGFQL
ncbi:MAG: hypothetical protein U5K99_01490 [Anaerolineales bacterium]|nr:hypothetical protein [Anaerolineales bacterium]